MEEIDLYRVILKYVGRGGYIILRPRRSRLVLDHVDCLNRSHRLLDVTKLVRYTLTAEVGEGDLIGHGESFVICCWTDDIDYCRKDNQVQNIQPSIQEEPTISSLNTPKVSELVPSTFPILRGKVISSTLCKSRNIQKKERK